MGAEGFFSSISDWFSDLLVPSLLSRHQLASRLGCWLSSISFSFGRGGAFRFVRALGFGSSSSVLSSVSSSDMFSCLKFDES